MQVFAVLLLAGLAAAIPYDRRAFFVYDDAHFGRLGAWESLPLSKYSIEKPAVTVSEDKDDLSTLYFDRVLREYPKYREYGISEDQVRLVKDYAPQYDEILASPLREKALAAPVYEKFIDAPLSKRVLAAPLRETVLSTPAYEKYFDAAPLSKRVLAAPQREEILAAPLREKVLSAPVYEKYFDAPLSKRILAAPLREKVLSAPVYEKYFDAPLSKSVLAAPLREKVWAVPSYEKFYTQKNVFAPRSELVDYPEKRYSTLLEKSVPTAYYTLA